jgi:hypothetical protein
MKAVEVPRNITYHAIPDVPTWYYTTFIHDARALKADKATLLSWLPLELLLLLEDFQMGPRGPKPPRFSYRRWAMKVVCGRWHFCARCQCVVQGQPDSGNEMGWRAERSLKWQGKMLVCKMLDQCVSNLNAVIEHHEKMWPTYKRQWRVVEIEGNPYNVFM